MALFSIRHSYLPKLGFEKKIPVITWRARVYIVQITARLGGFQAMELPRRFLITLERCWTFQNYLTKPLIYQGTFKVWVKLYRVWNMSNFSNKLKPSQLEFYVKQTWTSLDLTKKLSYLLNTESGQFFNTVKATHQEKGFQFSFRCIVLSPPCKVLSSGKVT